VQTTQTFQQPAAWQPVYTQQPAVTKKMRSAALAAILSVWLGLGQAYNGQLGKGLGLFVVWIIFLGITNSGVEFFSVLWLIIWAYGIYDAYATSIKLNSGVLPYTEINTGQIVGFIIGSIIIGAFLWAFVVGFIYGLSNPYYYY